MADLKVMSAGAVKPLVEALGAEFAQRHGITIDFNFGTAGALVFSSIVIVSVTTSLAVYLMVAPRVYYAMARDGLFFKGVAEVSPRFGTPARAILIQAVLAGVLVSWKQEHLYPPYP